MRLKKLWKPSRSWFSILIIGGIIFFIQSDFWQIKKIRCLEDDSSCATDIYSDLASQVIGRHWLFLSSKTVINQIRSNHPFIKEVKVSKNIPWEVLFILKKRQPMAAVIKEGSPKDYLIVDEEGFWLKTESTTDLPKILVKDISLTNIGQRLTESSIIKTIELVQELQLNLLDPKTAQVNQFNIEIWLSDQTLAVFSLFKEASFQINSLQLILSRAKIEGKKITRLDLRFDKPVIIYD